MLSSVGISVLQDGTSSDEDWMTLESFLGMDENELEWFYPEQGFERGADEEIGFKLKSVDWDGGNSTGFSALSNGWRWTGVFAYPEYTNFWTSTQISPEVSWARILREGESGIARQPYLISANLSDVFKNQVIQSSQLDISPLR